MKPVKSSKILVIGFVLIISVPALSGLFGVMPANVLEGESGHDVTLWQIKGDWSGMSLPQRARALISASYAFVRRSDDYYRSHFSFRGALVNMHTFIVRSFLAGNPLPNKVVEGSDGWFFLGDDYSGEISESMGLLNFSDDELAVVVDSLSARAFWLREHDISYYVFIAPNKTSIYGNKLQIQRSHRRTPAQQLDSALFGKVNVLNFGKILRECRELVYYKTDSHWNDHGALRAYEFIIESVTNSLSLMGEPIDRSNLNFDTVTVSQRDLTRQLGIRISETVVELSLRNPTAKATTEHWPMEGARVRADVFERRYLNSKQPYKAVFFHDSFGEQLEPFLAESFGESVFVWDHRFNRKAIEREKPDIVVHIIAERNLEVIGQR